MKILLWRRLRPDGSRAPNFTYKFTWRGRPVVRSTKFSAELCGSLEAARRDARAKALAHARGLELDPIADVDARFRARAARAIPTLAEFKVVFDAGAVGRLSPGSAIAAWLQILNILRRATPTLQHSNTPTAPLHTPLSSLTSALLQRYAQAVLDHAAATGANARRLMTLKRSANSTWSTARMAFSRQMREYYTTVKFPLPACIDTFTKRPPFDAKTIRRKTQYNAPNDHVIAATFRDLEDVQRLENPNLYCAVHLALAFGLRKGEIIGARVGDVKTLHGIRGFEVNENWVGRRPLDLPKNREERPFIHPKNGSLARLDPFLAGRDPADYILTGATRSHRLDYTFRAIGAWMRRLGWGTQKTCHEFRSYGIAQVTAAEGIFEASKWARHSTVVITQQNYGHHIRRTGADLPIQLPEPPSHFTPKLATA